MPGGKLLTMTDRQKKIADKYWRLQHLYKIKDKNKRIINMKFNRVQQIIANDILHQHPIRHFTLKYRQAGVSTFWLLYYLDDTIFHRNVTTGILAHKWESLTYLWDIIKLAFKYLPDRIKPRLGTESAKALEFKDINSKIFISLSVRSAGLHNLHISEWCFCRDEEIEATLGATSPLTNISGESTGNGVGNHGYFTYQDGKTGDNEYKVRFFPWFFQDEYRLPLKGMDPEYIMRNLNQEEKELQKLLREEYSMELEPSQVLFRRQKKRTLKSTFPQEYPETDEDAFITSGSHFFNNKKLLALLNEAREWHREEKYFKKTDDYICFEPPNKEDFFVAGADTSEGVDDYSVLKIINVTKRREAFVYRARCGIKEFYQVCNEWGRKYNNALLAVEDNNTGHAVLLGLVEDCKYPNLYKERKATRLKKDKIKFKLGWHTDKISRTLLLNDLKYAIEEDDNIDVDHFLPEFTIFDLNLLKEGLTFIKNNTKFEAEAGKYDDDIFATGIAFQLYKEYKYVDSRKTYKGVLIGATREAKI